MSVTVVPEGQEPEPESESDAEPAVGPRSPLSVLRGKRKELQKKLYIDLAVPRWDEILEGSRLWVRYRPADPNVITTAMEKRERSHLAQKRKGLDGDPDWRVKANADILVDACVAVYDLPADEQPPEHLPDDLPTFSTPALSEAVDAPPSAVQTAMAVYGTHADLQVSVLQLLEWSGQASEEADQDFLGS